LKSKLINIAYILAAVMFLPVMLYQRLVRRKRRTGWRQRLGHIPARPSRAPCVWIHGVSVGEINAARPLVHELGRQLKGFEVAISATTDTGFARATQLFPSQMVFRYPLDFSWVVARTMERVRPRIIVLMELEVWPNLVAHAARAGIPVVVANGRITDRRRVGLLNLPLVRRLTRGMFASLAGVGVQDETYAERFRRIGVPTDRIRITGSLKWDSAVVADRVERDDALARCLMIDRNRPLWVAGSTGPGEEAALLQAYKQLLENHPQWQLAIVPRHPERFGAVAHLIEDYGFACLRRSKHLERPPTALKARTVFLGDTMGELRRFYALADLVFVGRSLAPLGGSDVMEVAGLARPMLFGPHMTNFAEAATKLLSARAAVQIADAESLLREVRYLTTHRVEATRMGRQARQVLLLNQGASRKTAEMIQKLLDGKGNK